MHGAHGWDIRCEDTCACTVDVGRPTDLASGDYYLRPRFDEADEIAEEFEDNSEVDNCDQLTIQQLGPKCATLGQHTIPAGVPYTGPAPVLPKPLNMATVTWSLDNPATGMGINPATGRIDWPNSIASPFLYAITVRATNGDGTSACTIYIGVTTPPPVCPGDINDDGATDVFDFGVFSTYFGTTSGAKFDQGDLDGDGDIDVLDFSILASGFGCVE